MPLLDAAPLGTPCWIDLFSSDTDAIRAFYGELFGWTSDAAGEEFGGYINFARNGVPVAGCMKNDGTAGMPDTWTIYLATADAAATVESAAAHGGQVHMPAMQVMDLGSMAMVADPGGAAIGMWQPGVHKGFGILAEDGAPGYFELLTRDYAASVAFYQDVFGWDTHVVSDTDDFRYTGLSGSEQQLAGVMDASGFLPEGVPSHWSVYFGADDTDVAVAKAVSLGGSVVMAAEDTPYGRLATLADPTGALFKLVGRTAG